MKTFATPAFAVAFGVMGLCGAGDASAEQRRVDLLVDRRSGKAA